MTNLDNNDITIFLNWAKSQGGKSSGVTMDFSKLNGTSHGSYQLNRAITELPDFEVQNILSTAFMFYYCENLKKAPFFDTSNTTNMEQMLSNCINLEEIPLYNTEKNKNFASMFYLCKNLKNIPNFNTQAGTNFSNMFFHCDKLETAPNLNLQNGTNFRNYVFAMWGAEKCSCVFDTESFKFIEYVSKL